jgi:hypothetical protein
MNVLSKMAPQYFAFMEDGVSPLPLFLLSGALIVALWTFPERDEVETVAADPVGAVSRRAGSGIP